MVIDIDIKIANSDGKLIHRFSKQFDEKLEVSDKINKESGISKGFEDFLSEYLSASGRSIRERLINYPDTETYESKYGEQEEEEDKLTGYEAPDGISDSEVEYKIRIGSKKVFVGKIPFQVLNRINAVTDALDKTERKDRDDSVNNIKSKQVNYIGYNTKKQNDFNNKESIVDLDKNLGNIMLQALEKYESSFYHTSEESEII